MNYIYLYINSKELQDHRDEFPTLYKLAMNILPIKASSVPYERVFSSSKETTTARRNKLDPQIVEALQILKYGRKNAKGLNFIEGLDEKEEVLELEGHEIQQGDNYLESYTY